MGSQGKDLNQQHTKKNKEQKRMKFHLSIFLSVVAFSYEKPQGYSGQTESLDVGTLDTIGDIFGNTDNQNERIPDDNDVETGALNSRLHGNGISSAVEILQEDNYQPPDDYIEEETHLPLRDQATTEVDIQFANCGDYTDSLGYECVPYYHCHNGTIITDGSGLIDIRNGFGVLTPEDSKCPGFLDVCCKDPDFVPPPPPKIKYQPQCGRRNKNGLGVRIQGFKESESQFGEWPHMCAILHEKVVEREGSDGYGASSTVQETISLYQCGASLIAPGVLLTAGHCVDRFRDNPAELKVRCGEWDTQGETEPYPHQDRTLSSINIHPEFNSKNLHNDWAVLFTSEDFILSSHIDTACLPAPQEDFTGSICFATGWGKDKFGAAGEYQVVLKEIDLPVVDSYQCENKLRQTRLGGKYKLHDSFLCAGGVSGKDTCKGDGGSPLVCPSKTGPNTYVQAGIVAWGIGCGEGSTPGVYASVSKAACWIDYVMSCHHGHQTGDFSSYWGYSANTCQAWLDTKIQHLNRQREAIPRLSKVFQGIIDQFSQCSITWRREAAPLHDQFQGQGVHQQDQQLTQEINQPYR